MFQSSLVCWDYNNTVNWFHCQQTISFFFCFVSNYKYEEFHSQISHNDPEQNEQNDADGWFHNEKHVNLSEPKFAPETI